MRRRDALPDPETAHGLFELDAALRGEPAADPDLALLVADVAAARPEPDAAFLASLDARVRAGFPREDAPPRRGAAATPWYRKLLGARVVIPAAGTTLAAGLVVLLLINVDKGNDVVNDSASSGSSASVTSAPAPSDAAGESAPAAKDAVVPQSSPFSSKPTAPSSVAPPKDSTASARKVERGAELTLTPAAADVQDTADGVVRETQAAGGYVLQSSIQTRDDGGTATFALRIPSARLDETLARLSKLAHVGALNQSATDITAQTASAAELLSDARDERNALLRALGRATTDRQIASLRARLRDNRSEIAQRKGALDAQRRRADLASVTVNVAGTGQAESDGGGAWTPRDALHDAGRVLEVAGGVALIALAVLAPLAILAALGALGGRAVRRRRRETALDRTA
jgi:hypothetical protein